MLLRLFEDLLSRARSSRSLSVVLREPFLTTSPGSVLWLCAEIIAKDKTLEPAPRAKGIALGLTMFQGEIAELRKECA